MKYTVGSQFVNVSDDKGATGTIIENKNGKITVLWRFYYGYQPFNVTYDECKMDVLLVDGWVYKQKNYLPEDLFQI